MHNFPVCKIYAQHMLLCSHLEVGSPCNRPSVGQSGDMAMANCMSNCISIIPQEDDNPSAQVIGIIVFRSLTYMNYQFRAMK